MLTISCCSSAPKPPYHTAVDQYVFAACTTTPGAPATNDEHFSEKKGSSRGSQPA
jgi:hypothetical protein